MGRVVVLMVILMLMMVLRVRVMGMGRMRMVVVMMMMEEEGGHQYQNQKKEEAWRLDKLVLGILSTPPLCLLFHRREHLGKEKGEQGLRVKWKGEEGERWEIPLLAIMFTFPHPLDKVLFRRKNKKKEETKNKKKKETRNKKQETRNKKEQRTTKKEKNNFTKLHTKSANNPVGFFSTIYLWASEHKREEGKCCFYLEEVLF